MVDGGRAQALSEETEGRDQRGYTLVEIMAVILVLGILATIAISSYEKFKRRAYDVSVMSDMRRMQTPLSTYQLTHNFRYPTDGGSAFTHLGLEGWSPSNGLILGTPGEKEPDIVYASNPARDNYCIEGSHHLGTGAVYHVMPTGGVLDGPCPLDMDATPGIGSGDGNGNGGGNGGGNAGGK